RDDRADADGPRAAAAARPRRSAEDVRAEPEVVRSKPEGRGLARAGKPARAAEDADSDARTYGGCERASGAGSDLDGAVDVAAAGGARRRAAWPVARVP